jgi:hypothetical protein
VRDIYLGDSYDIVKRFWRAVLRHVAPLYAHPKFVPDTLQEDFTALTEIPLLNLQRLPPEHFGVLLDPDTGIPHPNARSQRVSRKHAPLKFISELFSDCGALYVVCFDQSRVRSKIEKLETQHEKKRKHLFSLGVFSFYYVSHAPFLFMAKQDDIITKVRKAILDAGVPETAGGRIRLQSINSRAPMPHSGRR